MRDLISKHRAILMSFSMILVIIYHIQPSVNHPIFYYTFSVYGLWGVDIFLFLSGFGCTYALTKYNNKTFLKRRFNRIIPTCLFVGVLLIIADYFFLVEKNKYALIYRLFLLNRWYIQAILILYLLSPLFFKLIKKYGNYGFYIIILMSIFASFIVPNKILMFKWIIWRIPVFIIGIYIALNNFKISKFQIVLSIIAFTIALYNRLYQYNAVVVVWPYLVAFSMPLICNILAKIASYINKIGGKNLYKIIELLGIYSLEIYLIHEYVLWILEDEPISNWIKYSIFFLFVFCLSLSIKFIVSSLINKWPSIKSSIKNIILSKL